ncbi:hypothetical protein ACCAA_1390007 [Candidatus Accumulibacter aalborgensis]|uniref:Uncharacterized protein n=2 Tax=Candidatus Accumulibacter aalborgensis TaxID=1860102 RepID=A0A1A8XKH4_9PROT|nr:hypothetical protein ACCAA_1390007 [Candidatus Accumulibacter aalborgensis]
MQLTPRCMRAMHAHYAWVFDEEAMTNDVNVELVRTAVFFAIWFTYFNISKRIKATFPEGGR